MFRRPSNNANGNTRDRQGRLVTCEHDSRPVSRTEYDGTVTVLIDKFDGKPLNSPNDVVVKSDELGLVYRSAVRHSRPLRGSPRLVICMGFPFLWRRPCGLAFRFAAIVRPRERTRQCKS